MNLYTTHKPIQSETFFQEADFGIADLTINAIRETAVDFTSQFYSTKVAIMFKTGALRWTYLLEPLQVLYFLSTM